MKRVVMLWGITGFVLAWSTTTLAEDTDQDSDRVVVKIPDTTRTWHFTELATFDATMMGMGDIFAFDIPLGRLGNTNSSISMGAGVGFIYSATHDSQFSIPIPITVTGRFGVGAGGIEFDTKIGAVAYYYSQNSSQHHGGAKLDFGVMMRVPFSTTGSAGFLLGFDLYVEPWVSKGTVPLPEFGFTF